MEIVQDKIKIRSITSDDILLMLKWLKDERVIVFYIEIRYLVFIKTIINYKRNVY